jgi:FdhD protein
VPIAIDAHVARASIERIRGDERSTVEDELAIEEPLEIRVDGEALAVTMRTPGEDEELAAGFLAGEGLILGRDDIASVGPTPDLANNTIDVRTTGGLRRDPGARNFYTTSSCGVCGKGALDSVRVEAGEAPPPGEPITLDVALQAPPRARAEQSAFERTGGLHATALFTHDGELVVVREDVGRHNAMDKAIGSRLLAGQFPVRGLFACLSGRASFELVQKAALAGLSGIVAVGAPSSLAVELARERQITLCGFVKRDSLNVYSGTLSM